MKRIYGVTKPIIGLTGGIATGKSTVSNILKDMGYFVICADTLVHDIYKRNESINFIKEKSPECLTDGNIDFAELRKAVFSDEKLKLSIENFIYSRIESQFHKTLQKNPSTNVIFYDVPLLFELSLDLNVDLSICVYCSREMQMSRLVARDGQSPELAQSILENQMDIEDKKIRATYVINNTSSLKDLKHEVFEVIKQIELQLKNL